MAQRSRAANQRAKHSSTRADTPLSPQEAWVWISLETQVRPFITHENAPRAEATVQKTNTTTSFVKPKRNTHILACKLQARKHLRQLPSVLLMVCLDTSLLRCYHCADLRAGCCHKGAAPSFLGEQTAPLLIAALPLKALWCLTQPIPRGSLEKC